MKHSIKITYLLLGIFLLAQFIGLFVVSKNISFQQRIDESGNVVKEIQYQNTPYLETLQVVNESMSFIMIFFAILFGTVIGLLFARFKTVRLWKVWFFFAVTFALYKAFSSFIPALIAFIAGIAFAYFKIFKPNIYVHNFTELFVYAGIAAMFVPILNVISASVLLVLIAIYDAYAVWKSKHMITLAKFQTQSVFAGLTLQYNSKTGKIMQGMKKADNHSKAELKIPLPPNHPNKAKHPQESPIKNAILGGGDIAFPLLFSGAVLKGLLANNSAAYSIVLVSAIPICAAVALGYLFYIAEKNKFYPAMPFISAGCFVGYGIVYLISLI